MELQGSVGLLFNVKVPTRHLPYLVSTDVLEMSEYYASTIAYVHVVPRTVRL